MKMLRHLYISLLRSIIKYRKFNIIDKNNSKKNVGIKKMYEDEIRFFWSKKVNL